MEIPDEAYAALRTAWGLVRCIARGSKRRPAGQGASRTVLVPTWDPPPARGRPSTRQGPQISGCYAKHGGRSKALNSHDHRRSYIQCKRAARVRSARLRSAPDGIDPLGPGRNPTEEVWVTESNRVTSLEGASGTCRPARCYADLPGQTHRRWTAVDLGTRQAPVLRARGGHGRRGRTRLRPAAVGHQLGRWARLVQADHLPRWQAATAMRQESAHLRRAGGGVRATRPRWSPLWLAYSLPCLSCSACSQHLPGKLQQRWFFWESERFEH
jgi:hypothetical protein